MRRLRAWLLLGFAGLSGLALFVSRSDATAETVRLVVPGVWFREGDMDRALQQHHHRDEGLPHRGGRQFPSGARAALADATQVSDKPVKYVFDTHHHGDHLYGNPVWTQAGATTLAFMGVVEELKRLEPAAGRGGKTRKDVAGVRSSMRRSRPSRTSTSPSTF